MAIRDYTDAEGTRWTVWSIPPRHLPARSGVDRRQLRAEGPLVERRVLADRRRRDPDPILVQGWLCFECEGERRRLTPIPGDWTQCDEGVLGRYLEEAVRVRRLQRIVGAGR